MGNKDTYKPKRAPIVSTPGRVYIWTHSHYWPWVVKYGQIVRFMDSKAICEHDGTRKMRFRSAGNSWQRVGRVVGVFGPRSRHQRVEVEFTVTRLHATGHITQELVRRSIRITDIIMNNKLRDDPQRPWTQS